MALIWASRAVGVVPAFERGVSSVAIVGAIRSFTEDPVRIDTTLRVLMLVAVLAFSAFAVRLSGVGAGWGVLCLALLVTSKLPWLWLSSELVAASALAASLAAYFRRWWTALVVAALVLAFAKPDLIVPSLVAGVLLLPDRRRRVWFAGLALVVLALSLRAQWAQPPEPLGRSLFAFHQHYSAVIAPHQVTPVKVEPFSLESGRAYVDPIWGGHADLRSLILSDPDKYVDFLFLSMARSLNIARHSGLLWLAILVVAVTWRHIRSDPLTLASVAFVALNLAVISLVAFVHIRYGARFYVLSLVLITHALGTRRVGRSECRVIAVLLIALAVVQAWTLPGIAVSGYYLSD
jgi:hypothetical protein